MALFLKPTGVGHASSDPFPLPDSEGSVRVGRQDSNDLQVAHSTVSAEHARFEIRGESNIELVDCDSSHGTFVNGERIAVQRVKAGDLIRFATAEFELFSSSNGGLPRGDETSIETRPVAPLPGTELPPSEVEELRDKIAEQDAEIESLRQVLAATEKERDKAIVKLKPIEAVWDEYGDGAQAELKQRCSVVKAEFEKVSAELESLRGELKEEIRKSQKLSRRNPDPEKEDRPASVSIALDAEQETYRALIERIELFDQMIEGYRRSRKFRDIADELQEFREKLFAILREHGVEPFVMEPGTPLTLKHRKEVQVLQRKGWGTKQYIERPFRPGEINDVVRPGFRVGTGENIAILRKVEVTVREGGD